MAEPGDKVTVENVESLLKSTSDKNLIEVSHMNDMSHVVNQIQYSNFLVFSNFWSSRGLSRVLKS
jgi:hypothetical protein